MRSLNQSPASETPHNAKWLDHASLLALIIFVFAAVRYQLDLLDYIEWGDESETLVAVKMISAGQRLYSEIFNHHGPLVFLPGVILEKFGSFGIPAHRLPIAALQLVALFAVYRSPLHTGHVERRLYTMLAGSAMLLFLPDAYGHTYIYQSMAGLMIVIILAQYTLPALLSPDRLSVSAICIGNFFLAALPFMAITYAPIAGLLFLASWRNQYGFKAVAAASVSVVGNVVFLATIGSIPGFIAFHLCLNAQVLPLYNVGQGIPQFILHVFQAVTNDIGNAMLLAIFLCGAAALVARERPMPWRSILVALGLGSLLIRGGHEVHNLPYFYAMLAVPLVLLFAKPQLPHKVKVLGLLFTGLFVIRVCFLVPSNVPTMSAKKLPTETEFSQLVKLMTEPDDKIIAYSFQNYQYLAAERLPASGHFFYLPWQEKYNEQPILGIKIDACRQITDYRPKVMLIDKWKVWGQFPWESYAGCLQHLIDTQYVQIPGTPHYVRKDLILGGFSVEMPERMRPSPELVPAQPIALAMDIEHRDEKRELKRIGILFGTHGRMNAGTAELRLQEPDGAYYTKTFPLSELKDNQFTYFDLQPGNYTQGAIVAGSGMGISTWNIQDEQNASHTCMSFFYSDGTLRLTPGCPLL